MPGMRLADSGEKAVKAVLRASGLPGEDLQIPQDSGITTVANN
jgi:hypothetical protein